MEVYSFTLRADNATQTRVSLGDLGGGWLTATALLEGEGDGQSLVASMFNAETGKEEVVQRWTRRKGRLGMGKQWVGSGRCPRDKVTLLLLFLAASHCRVLKVVTLVKCRCCCCCCCSSSCCCCCCCSTLTLLPTQTNGDCSKFLRMLMRERERVDKLSPQHDEIPMYYPSSSSPVCLPPPSQVRTSWCTRLSTCPPAPCYDPTTSSSDGQSVSHMYIVRTYINHFRTKEKN